MKTPTKKSTSKNLFNKDIPLYLSIIIVVASISLVYFLMPKPQGKIMLVQQTKDCISDMEQVRSKDFHFTQPLFLADVKMESARFNSIKNKLKSFIEQSKAASVLNDISIYYRNLNDGEWFSINSTESYYPASIMKVSFLIAMLKQSESEPHLLDKKIYFEKPFANGYERNTSNFSLKLNSSYSIKELLYDMIVFSDNDALTLISMNVKPDVYNKLFSDLGITPPPTGAVKGFGYTMSVVDCCKFFRVLYSSTYLNSDNSEFALELLTKSTFKEGLVKNLGSDFPVAHKFGERMENNVQQLHELGIFYVDHKPYLLGVMSTGHDFKQLSSVLSQISEIVYSESNQAN